MKKNGKIHIACIVGTRPEIIKMAPVLFQLKKSSWAIASLIDTAQHRDLLDDMLEIFDLTPDFDLDIMLKDQTLGELTGNLCRKLDSLLATHHFDAILAIGDTTTVMISALLAFYHKIPFGHIEAGLRTFDRYQPFPEEINRVLSDTLSTWYFAPTEQDKANLIRENINPDLITVTGNTVIDALYWVLKNRKVEKDFASFKKVITVTAHRRENHGVILHHICQAILLLSQRFLEIDFVVPMHPNPNVQKVMLDLLANQPRIHLFPPFKYDEFAHLLQKSILILTDSGGIQEEAAALHKPMVVMRNCTERTAVVEEGLGILAGTETDAIVSAVSDLLTNETMYNKMVKSSCPFGDGQAALYIVNYLEKVLTKT